MECVDFGSLLSARDRWKVFWTVFWPFPKILYWADFDLMEPIFIYIFVNGNKKKYHGTFFLLMQVPPPCVLKILKRSITDSIPPWRFDGRHEWQRVGSQGRKAHPAAPWTPVSSGPWSTWDRYLTRWILCWMPIDIFIFAFSSPPPSVASLCSKFPKTEACHWKVGVLSYYLIWCCH